MEKKIGSDLCLVLCPVSLAVNFVVQTDSLSGTLRKGDLIIGVDFLHDTERVFDPTSAKDRDDMIEILRDNFYGAGVYVRRTKGIFLINDFYEMSRDEVAWNCHVFRSQAAQIMVAFSKKNK